MKNIFELYAGELAKDLEKARERIQAFQREARAYIESPDFEGDLDRFAEAIGFEYGDNPGVADTERKARIVAKGKLLFSRCRADVLKTAALGTTLGMSFNPAMAMNMTVVFGSAHAAYLFLTALFIVIGKDAHYLKLVPAN